MKSSCLGLLTLAASLSCVCAQTTTKLSLTLTGNDSVTRNRVRYICDATAAKIHLPTAQFTVEYITTGNSGLAIVPVEGESLVFAQVISASGVRYAAGRYEWGSKGPDAWLTDISRGDGQRAPTAFCHQTQK